jgi:undecaprenyl-phosphate 4-deoxy-4-formamido-L-arabinose transferase
MGVMLDGEYEAMFMAEESHWWYRGLHDQVLLALGTAPVDNGPRRILDAGCGTGKMLQTLHVERPFGFDLSGQALMLASRRTPGRFVQATTQFIPYLSGVFDAVLSLDVLSNVPQHAVQDVLHELLRVLKPGGRLVLNATAFQWLHSEHDRAVGVVHRYTVSEVRHLLEDAGFEIDRCGYSNAILFLPAACYRLVKKILPAREGEPSSDLFALPVWINSLLFRIRSLENRLIQCFGVSMPAGLSVFATAHRPMTSSSSHLVHTDELQADISSLDVSVVIPVYNAEKSIAPLCIEIMAALSCRSLQIVLVNDGSRDSSHEACLGLCGRYPEVITYLRLSKNFGEHNAVMAGLKAARGDYTLILDDDFQNPPSESPRLLAHCIAGGFDAVYGAFIEKRHSYWRNMGSWLNGSMSRWLLGKPKGLYLSSFKCLNRFLREKVVEYTGPWPYLDGLILRSTDRVGQVAVEHHERTKGVSGYTPAKLISLWLTIFASFSPAPARLAGATGLIFALAGIGSMAAGLAMWSSTWMLGGLACFLGGAVLAGVGLAAEYAARALMELNGAPQYIVREHHGAGSAPGEEYSRGLESGRLPKPRPDMVAQTDKKKAISSREPHQ